MLNEYKQSFWGQIGILFRPERIISIKTEFHLVVGTGIPADAAWTGYYCLRTVGPAMGAVLDCPSAE